MRLVLDELAARSLADRVRCFATDKAHGGTGPLPQRIVDGAVVASRFRARLAESSPAVVHLACGSGWGLTEAGIFAALARRAGSRVVVHLHAASLFQRMDSSAVQMSTALRILGAADAVAVLGTSMAEGLHVRGLKGPKVAVIPNGVVLGPSTPLPEEATMRWLLVGSVEERKGLGVITEALEMLGPGNREVLWIGPVRAQPMAVIRAEAAGITFPGRASPQEVTQALSRSHALLMPSLREGLPFAILEALAAARPVLASQVGAVDEVLARGGRLLPPGEPGALAESIRSWEEDRLFVQAMGAAARAEVADGYTVSHTVDALLKLWSPWWTP